MKESGFEEKGKSNAIFITMTWFSCAISDLSKSWHDQKVPIAH